MTLEPGLYHCLSIWQPWAWAIFKAGKGIENRNWPAPYRGKLLIHAAKNTSDLARVCHLLQVERHIMPDEIDLVFGAILGFVELYDCKWSTAKSDCGWGVPHAYHWHLRNPTLLDEPIPWRGLQRIFPVRIADPAEQHPVLL